VSATEPGEKVAHTCRLAVSRIASTPGELTYRDRKGMMMRTMVLTLVLAGLLILSACGASSSSDSITDIVWQWTSVTDRTSENETMTSVPHPEDYTIVFNEDGTLEGRADCNAFSGAYSQDGGLTITLGATTRAYCGDASMDAQYLQLLANVSAGGPDGQGGLALETPGGAQRMMFQNGGVAQ
jgi:heat shock protein HslJ